MITLMNKVYDGESIIDAEMDVGDACNPEMNPMAQHIPSDEHGFLKGKFTVTVTWEPDNE